MWKHTVGSCVLPYWACLLLTEFWRHSTPNSSEMGVGIKINSPLSANLSSDVWWRCLMKSFSYFQRCNSGRSRKRSCGGVLWKVHVVGRPPHLEGCLFVLFKKERKITIITGNHCLNHNLGPREQCSCTNLLCYCFLKCYFRNKLWPYVLLWLR